MQELLDKLKSLHGLSTEQSYAVLNTIKDFVKEKFPMAAGAIDNVLNTNNTGNTNAITGSTAAGDTGTTEGPAQKGGSFLDTESEIGGEDHEKEKQAAKDKMDSFAEEKKKD